MLLLTFTLSLLPEKVLSQSNATEGFPNKNWPDGASKTFDLGDMSTLSGLELNFWMRPSRVANVENSTSILKFLGLIELQYSLYIPPGKPLSNALIMNYAQTIYTAPFPMTTPDRWSNVNLRVQFSNNIMLAIWFDKNNLKPDPDVYVIHPNPKSFNVSTIEFKSMEDPFIYIADVRIFDLDAAQSWAQYFKYYLGIWPQPSIYEGQRQYYTSYNSVIYTDINNTALTLTNSDPVNFPIERCPYRQYITDIVDATVT